jgi:DNA modification methylase
VLDPFAGGSVRGLVASRLGLHYAGIELRQEQVEANQRQASKICRPGEPAPIWLAGDCREALDQTAEGAADMIMTCPPYGDLEVYSTDPRDISGYSMSDFDEAMRVIVLKATRCLAMNRFSIWVISDYRTADGSYAMLPSKLRFWQRDAGMKLYNEAILLNVAGSLPIRAGKQFQSTRKLGRMHQEILIFLKGDERLATAALPKIDAKGIDNALEAIAAAAAAA